MTPQYIGTPPIPKKMIAPLYPVKLQSLSKLVAKNLKILSLKMEPFKLRKLKGYEMHLSGLARLKPFANHYSSPAPALQCWGLIGNEEHNFMFQHCHGGAGDDFTVMC